MFAAAVLFTSWQAVAQSPPAKTATTWQDLGFNQLPEGFSTDEIPLFEGLNEARGTWSFEGETTDGEAATPLKGSLHIMGNPKSGMLPIWKMVWGWPADDPGHAIIHTIMASPRKNGFDLMLTRIGPVKNPGAGQDQTQDSAHHRFREHGIWKTERLPGPKQTCPPDCAVRLRRRIPRNQSKHSKWS